MPRGVIPLAATMLLFIGPGIDSARPAAMSRRPVAATSSAVCQTNDGRRSVIDVELLTSWNSVRVKPGQSAVTFTPVPRTSSCRLSDNEVT